MFRRRRAARVRAAAVQGRGAATGRTSDRAATKADLEHLKAFAGSHTGVEVYLEPPTMVTGTTVVVVAGSGEWTRRRIGDAGRARSFARRLAVPLYDVTVTGYPARMRAWTGARTAADASRSPGLRRNSGPDDVGRSA